MASKARSRTARWKPKLKRLRVLSLRQPWAWLVVNGYKDIENRSWRTNHRGPLLIHASNNRSLTTPKNVAAIENKYRVHLPRDFEFGGVIGIVDVVDVSKRIHRNGNSVARGDGF
jgi:ASCH domain